MADEIEQVVIETPVVETPPEGTGAAQAIEETPEQGQAPSDEAPVTLVEMPDGRKVTPEVAIEEYKRLQGEFTKKSQRLAELEKPKDTPRPWEDPNYQASSVAELIQIAKEEAKREMLHEQSSKSEAERAQQAALDAEISAIKAKDANLNEAAVFDFANKRSESLGIKYPTFSAAYSDYKAFQKTEKLIEKRVVEANKQRQADPVSAGAAPSASAPLEYAPGMSLHEKAQMALQRYKK